MNKALLTDFYEFTMANGFFMQNMRDTVGYFDLFFRRVPDNAGFAIMAGVSQVIEFLRDLRFDDEDIDFLRGKGLFPPEFLEYLRNFRFTCDVWAVAEGTPIFPNEPILIVRGPIIEAQIIETMLLLTINHQSLIATKANRIVRAAEGRPVLEFGSRRAHGYDGAIYGARAAYIGGCAGTACTVAEQLFGIPSSGTMAHSWIQSFPDELSAFVAYAKTYPDNCVLLVDTINVLKSGLPNAVTAYTKVLAPLKKRMKGIRIDSGDITYLSKKARKFLDEAGLPDCKILASNSLDEYIIRDTQIQGSCVDMYGVGERLITSRSEPVFGGVYKLAAIGRGDTIEPKIKLSENVSKITLPGFKSLYRLYERETGKAIADVVTLYGEQIDDTQPYEIFDPEHTWKRKRITDFTAKPLLYPVFERGTLVYDEPDIHSIQKYCRRQVETLWDEVKRFENPHTYYVDLSESLWRVRQQMLGAYL